MEKQLVRLKSFFKITSIDEEKYVIRGVFSTGDEDRHGEVIDQSGWDVKDFLQNPVIQLFHDCQQFPVAKAIELGMNQEGNLAGAIQFAVEEYDVAKTAFNLYKNGFMRAFSVGFECLMSEMDPVNDTVVLKKNTLYEISCVNVPANAGALAYSKGIDMKPLEAAMKTRDRKAAASHEIELDAMLSEDEAIDVISKADVKTIEKAIRALTDALNAISKPDTAKAEAGAKVERSAHCAGGNKKIPVNVINRALRSLLSVKKLK